MGSTGDLQHPLWDQILGLVRVDLFHRCSMRFVALPSRSGLCDPSCREIGELTEEECQRLSPTCRQQVLELLIERHLAGQGEADLIRGTLAYRKPLEDLTPDDLPYLQAAYRYRLEEAQNLLHDGSGSLGRTHTGSAKRRKGDDMATEKIPEEVLDTFAEIRARLVELGEQVVEIDQLVVDAMTKLLRPELFEAVAPRFPVSDGSVGLVAALDRIKGKEARQQYYAGFSMTEAQ